MKRRTFLLSACAAVPAYRSLFGRAALAHLPDYPSVAIDHPLTFPRDYGAHADFRTEWWYVTGWLQTDAGTAMGFQVTFFRSRPALEEANPSRFAPRQLLFANAALSDPRAGRALHDQRAARSGFGLVQASNADTDVHIDDWLLRRDRDGRYRLDVATPQFGLALFMRPTHPLLLNGAAGYSRKGPLPSQASYYYSEPGLAIEGVVKHSDGNDGKKELVHGYAWLDHEWSSELLAEEAVGWDWIGINLDDGGAVMAFQIRDQAGNKFWTGGTVRTSDGDTKSISPESIRFTPLRWWRSEHTGARYPIAMRVDIGNVHLALTPLMEDQEFDSRATTGAVYWEGAVTALDATGDALARHEGKPVGRGYLELTGYYQRLKL
jgi:predicted secreted hydrolase